MSAGYNPETTALDPEEQWYEDHFDEFTNLGSEVRESLVKAASQPPKILSGRKQLVSIRLDPKDVEEIKKIAGEMGFAYQALISSLIHQYAKGKLISVTEARKLLKIR